MSVLIHIPHSSTLIPAQYRSDILLNNKELKQELLAMTDLYTDELFPTDKARLYFMLSRLVCDVERFRDDSKETMAARGMGAVYTTSSQSKPLRLFNAQKREEILRTFYDAHHSAFTNAVKRILQNDGHCLIIDAHSFSNTPLPHEPNQDTPRADICIGTDDFHTPEALATKCKSLFESFGLTVAFNAPFAGTIVSLEYYEKNSAVSSIMIEVNRKLYMDSRGKKTVGFADVQRILRYIIEEIG